MNRKRINLWVKNSFLGIALGLASLPVSARGIEKDSWLDFLSPILGSTYDVPLETGFQYRNNRLIKHLSIPIYDFYGPCPGREIGFIEIAFSSANIPPSENLMVLISNITPEMNTDPIPFDQQSYDKGRISDKIKLTFGYRNRKKFLVSRDGENQFEYKILNKKDKEILEEGRFSAIIDSRLLREYRSTTTVRESRQECETDSRTKKRTCRTVYSQTQVCKSIGTRLKSKVLGGSFEHLFSGQ